MGGAELMETRLVELPPCPFEDFLLHMNQSDSSEWTWTFIEMCSRFGVFHSTPGSILLARPVNSELPEKDLLAFNDLDPNHESTALTFPPDTWHILYASGSPSEFFDLCPYPLEFVSWYRHGGEGKLKTHSFNRLKKHFHVNKSTQA